MQFRKFNTSKKIEINYIEYINKWLDKYPHGKISIGSDSKVKKLKKTMFVTTISMQYPNPFDPTIHDKGSHVIYSQTYINKPMALFERLWNEVERTRDVAVQLRDKLGIMSEIHIDLNPNEETGSYKVYKPAIGFFKGMGFTVFAKPDAPCASSASDILVNKRS